MTETTKRIVALQKENGLNDHQLEVGVGLPVSSVQAWTKGKKRKNGEIVESSPGIDSIVKLARYFNVSADYLLGLTDERKPLECRDVGQVDSPTSSVPAVFGEMPDLLSEERFINTAKIYHELPDEMRERAYMLIYGIAVGLGLNVEKIIGR